MNVGQLKAVVAALPAGVPDSAEVKVEMAIDNSRIGLLPYPVGIEKQDVQISPDASGNYAAVVTQADAVVFKQLPPQS